MKKWFILLSLILTACSQATGSEATDVKEDVAPPTASVDDAAQTPGVLTATPRPTTPAPEPTPAFLPPEPAPPSAASAFDTDFDKHTVSYSETLSGGPPKDGIPAIDDPSFVSVDEADRWLQPKEPVVLLEIGEDARAYLIQVLMWHEIVNDTVGDIPVALTFCPLCNTAIAFERSFEWQVLDFGTTGRLRFSNLIMYDRQTETWWQQANGEGIAGEFAGRQLTFLPAAIIGWADFKAQHPDGKVLSRDTGYSRSYGQNPYAGYNDIGRSSFLYVGEPTPGTLPPMARVLTVELDDEAVAYPNDVLQQGHVVNDAVDSTPGVLFWASGTASALEAACVAGGRDVGSGTVFLRELDGQILDFEFDSDKIVDEQTGSEWDIFGQAISGSLAGAQLTPVVSVNHFWFSWAAFKPETRIYES